MENLNCFMCGQVVSGGLNDLSLHFRRDHNLRITDGIPNTDFVCDQNGCDRRFVHFHHMRRHLIERHSVPAKVRRIENDNNDGNHLENIQLDYDDDDEAVVDDRNRQMNEEEGMNEVMQEDDECALSDDEVIEEGYGVDNDNDAHDLRSKIVKMIAKFHCNGSMTGTTIRSVLESSDKLILASYNFLKTQVMAQMTVGQIIDENLINNIKLMFQYDSPFKGLTMLNQQINAIKEQYEFVEPKEILLGRRMDQRLDKTNTYVPVQVLESFQYVPVIEVLKLLLTNKLIRQEILSETQSSEGMLNSFVDGQNFKTHPFFLNYKNAIRLRIYYDELEIVNPLGSKTSVHKLGVFYYVIGNLPNHMNSELSSIHVLLVCTHQDIVKYGFEKILSPFIDDLSKLESDEGILLQFEDEEFVLRGTVESFCGDGLAVHEVFNLLGPSSNKFCRLCLYSREDLHSGSLRKAPERTKDVYNEHLQLLQQTNYSDATKTLTGVKGDCKLNESRYFHTSQNKIFDVMHDFLCGICPMVVKLVLKQYVLVEGFFNTSFLNGTISAFNYGFCEYTNKPSANFTELMLNKRDHSLSQKAMQMWCLVRIFPFILSEKVPKDDKYMELILYMLRLMELIFAPTLSESQLAYLDEIIQEFIKHFKKLFPEVNLINKMHHISHYPECIRWSGPLLQFYCMRFEAKHGELKLRAQNMHNFKNAPKTVVRISQCVQSYKWSAENVTLNRMQVLSSTPDFVYKVLSKQFLSQLGFQDDDVVINAKSVMWNGVQFRKNLFVILEKSVSREDNLVLFGRIEEIIILQNRIHLLTSVCTTLWFDTDVHAYAIRLGNINGPLRFIEILRIPFYKPLCYWRKPKCDELFISLRHIVL